MTEPAQQSITDTTPTPLSPSDAVKRAFEYLSRLSTFTIDRYQNFRVEEIEQDTESNYLITLSYDFLGELPFEKKREYKSFKIEQNGRVVWMKIKEL